MRRRQTSISKAQQLELPIFEITEVLGFRDFQNFMKLQPMFATSSSRPQIKPIVYENEKYKLTIRSSDLGIATIDDYDILIFVISSIFEAIKNNEVSPGANVVSFGMATLLDTICRSRSTSNYKLVEKALQRLMDTSYEFLWKDESEGIRFSWIDKYWFKYSLNGNLDQVCVQITDLISKQIDEKQLLKISPQYFLLRPIEKQIYRFAVKYARQEKGHKFRLDNLEVACSSRKHQYFLEQIKKMVAGQSLPNFSLSLEESVLGGQLLCIKPSAHALPSLRLRLLAPRTGPAPITKQAEEEIRDLCLMAGQDYDSLLNEWRRWSKAQGQIVYSSSSAFLSWVQKRLVGRTKD